MVAPQTQNLIKKIKAAPSLLRLFLCLVCGMVTALALPPTYILPASLIGFGGFYILLAGSSQRGAILAGWLFGFGYFTIGLYWIGNALLVEGNDYAWAWPLAVAGLPALLSTFTAIAAYAIRRFASLHKVSGFVFFVLIYSLFEYLRGTLFTGFPWNLPAYIWGNNLPVMQTVSLGGAYSLSLLTIAWCAAIGFAMICGNKKHALAVVGIAALSFAASYGYGLNRLTHAQNDIQDNLKLRIVQPNIAQQNKWERTKINENFDLLLELTTPDQAPADNIKTLIIWPETATRSDMTDREDYKSALKRALPDNSMLLTGFLNREPNADGSNSYQNSLAVFDHNMIERDIYFKSHLVPFGEYIPFQKYIPLSPIASFTGFQSGKGPTTLSDGLPPFSPLICYEIIFPGKVKETKTPASERPERPERPEWIVNVTNDAWYGDSAGPYQHFVISRFRAAEEGIPVIRAANTGISAVISPYGRTIATLVLNQRGVIESDLPKAITNRTLYAHFGNILYFALLLCCCALFYQCKKQKI